MNMLNKALETNDIPLKEYTGNMTLFKLFEKAAEYGANRALEKCGKIKPLITKKEAYKMINQPAVDRALKQIPCPFKLVKKGGETSNVYIERQSFERWLLLSELSYEAVSKK